MLPFIFAIFVVLHGLVHLLYFGQSARRFELRPGLAWPDGSWVFSKFLEDKTIRNLASIACVVAAIAFVAGGVGVVIGQSWWRPVIVAVAAFSSMAFLLFWDGKLRRLNEQGAIAILINVAILVAVLVLAWPFP